jgi:hypothetical protein
LFSWSFQYRWSAGWLLSYSLNVLVPISTAGETKQRLKKLGNCTKIMSPDPGLLAGTIGASKSVFKHMVGGRIGGMKRFDKDFGQF